MIPDLIFDIGMHKGLDTQWYLAKGFRVVAVEANPALVKQAKVMFASDIAAGRLIIENIGISDVEGSLPFYVNLENDEWSSFDAKLGTRDATRHEVLTVQCINASTLFARHGVPYFVKIDIEGFDYFVIQSVELLRDKPKYVSVEDNGFASLFELYKAGCRKFKFMDQVDKWRIKVPNPPLEGKFAEGRFGACTSGPFGEEVPGPWLNLDEAALYYLQNIRPPGVGLREHWWDIHAKFS